MKWYNNKWHLWGIAGICLPLLLSACKDDIEGVSAESGHKELAFFAQMPNGFIKSRAVNQPKFVPGTAYHLFGAKVNNQTIDWSKNYLRKDYANAGSEVLLAFGADNDDYELKYDEKDNLFIPYDGYYSPTDNINTNLANRFYAEPLNFYGVAVPSELAPNEDWKENDGANLLAYNNSLLIEKFTHNKDNNGIYYTVARQEATKDTLPDVMWAKLEGQTAANSGKIVLPFKHTLSRLNFYAVKDKEVTSNISITQLTLTDYTQGTLSMETGLYSHGDVKNRDKDNVPVYNNETKPHEVTTGIIDAKPTDLECFANAFVFPTIGATYGSDVAGDKPEGHPIQISVTIKIGEEAPIQLKAATLLRGSTSSESDTEPFSFRPSHEYDVVLTLTDKNVVVTIIPQYYEYINEDTDLNDYELGEPTDFGGIIWAAQNLGATSSDAANSPEAWERSRGFYYQFGRSIPYYVRGSVLDPYPGLTYAELTDGLSNDEKKTITWEKDVPQQLYAGSNFYFPYSNNNYIGVTGIGPKDGNGQPTTEDSYCARAYPYIPRLWEMELKDNKTEKQAYAKFLSLYRFRSDPRNINGTEQFYDVKGQEVDLNVNYPNCVTDPYEANNITKEDNPEIDKKQQFAFTSQKKYQWVNNQTSFFHIDWDADHTISATNWNIVKNQPCPKGWRLPTAEEFKSIFPGSAKAGDISFRETPPSDNGYQGKNQTNWYHADNITVYRDVIDQDYGNDPCVYIGIKNDGLNQAWGTIYGIKRQGTKDVYAIRWQIITVKGEGVTPPRADEAGKDVGRGVLVINKYAIDKDLNITLAYRQATQTSENKAEYECVGLIDTNNNGEIDEGETIVPIDWDYPNGELQLPICGYVWSGDGDDYWGNGLIYSGSEAVYWTSTASTTQYGTYPAARAYSARIKFSGNRWFRNIFLYDDDKRAYGCSVRCVRDTNVDESNNK